MGALKPAVFALVAVLACLQGAAQSIDPGLLGDTLRPYLATAVSTVLPPVENETGEDLHREDIRVRLRLDVLTVDNDLIGILFGGGKVEADAIADLHLEFRGVSVATLDQAIQAATGDPRASLNGTFGVPVTKLALTAEEVRMLGAGLLLAYFQEFEARAAQDLLQQTLPGLTVLDLAMTWSNVAPFAYVTQAPIPGVPEFDPSDPAELMDRFGVPPLREPPIVLEARARLNYLTRVSLVGALQGLGPANQTAAQRTTERLLEEQGDPFLERSAFATLGISQLVDVSAPNGWRVEVEMITPKGFTIESTTSEMALAGDRRGAVVVLDGLGRAGDADTAAVATLSSRFLVTAIALVGVLLVGLVIRLPTEATVLAVHGGIARRRARNAAARQSRAKK